MKRLTTLALAVCLLIGSTTLAENVVDWSQWMLSPQSDQPIEYGHEDTGETIYQSYVSAIGFTGGCIPWVAWRESGTDYFQYNGWPKQKLLDYLLYLRVFGYQIVSDIRLSELRVITLEQRGTADTPRYITVSYDGTGNADGMHQPAAVIAVSSEYGMTRDMSHDAAFAALEQAQGIEVIEKRECYMFSLSMRESELSLPYAPQSVWDDYFTVSKERTNDGGTLLRYKAKSGSGFLAIHLRVSDAALISSPRLMTAYSIVDERPITHFAACMGVSGTNGAEGELSLSQLNSVYDEPFSFWVILPMDALYMDESHRLFISNTPNEYLDPERQLYVELDK